MSSDLWRVAVEAPLLDALTYSAPESFRPQRGQAVTLPLGGRKARGVVLGSADEAPAEFKIKSIESPDAEFPLLPEERLQWLEWMAKYYIYPVGLTVGHSYPPLRRENARKTRKSAVVPDVPPTPKPELTAEQSEVVSALSEKSGFGVHLVFGVTGSGKTEVYLRLLEKTLAEGKSALVVVPEISLTPQLLNRFSARFPDTIAVLHSQLTDRERTNQWWDVVEGRKKILIGARSALFCPIPDLGLVVVDEEHEPSYKQEEKLKYHGRDAAVMLGRFCNCPVILGSATPSLESWRNAQEGKYSLHVLKNRVGDRHLPQVEIVDMRGTEEPSTTQKKQKDDKERPYWMSPVLFERMKNTLEEGFQAAIFLNRRGFANVVLCKGCGYTAECPNCDIKLTLHAQTHLVCHYCDYHEDLKHQCPECSEGELESVGIGTELIESDLRKVFPDRNIARADRDEIQNRQDMEELVQRMESGEIDILIGTQMIAKGLDFPKLKLVGLALADVGFNMPDFRATERSFQLITQMAGRSGRHIKEGEDPGQVLVQCYNTEHDSLRFAREHDYVGFAQHESAMREALMYPPYGRLICFRIQSTDRRFAEEAAQRLARRARQLVTQSAPYQEIALLGPAEAPLARIRNQYRHQFLVKGRRADVLNSFARQVLGDESWLPNKTRILVDVDPINML